MKIYFFLLVPMTAFAQPISIPKNPNGNPDKISKTSKPAPVEDQSLDHGPIEDLTVGIDENLATKIVIPKSSNQNRDDELKGCKKSGPLVITCPDGIYKRTQSILDDQNKTKSRTDDAEGLLPESKGGHSTSSGK